MKVSAGLMQRSWTALMGLARFSHFRQKADTEMRARSILLCLLQLVVPFAVTASAEASPAMKPKRDWGLMVVLVFMTWVLSIWPADSFGQKFHDQPPNWYDWVEITAGNYHTCARQFNGSVYCWGGNDWGQVGDGSSGSGNITRRPSYVMNASQVD